MIVKNNKIRLIANLVLKNDIVVQSFKYSNFLPIGSIESSVKTFNRWGADEILISAIDRSYNNLGPNFNLLNKLSKVKINTPIIYSGGINNLANAKKVIELGADRIIIETLALKNLQEIEKISKVIGAQSLILSMPLVINEKNNLSYYNYNTMKISEIPENFIKLINQDLISEVLIVDPKNQGFQNKFDKRLLKNFKHNIDLIIYGGISNNNFSYKDQRIKAMCYGNSLNYSEHKIQKIKTSLKKFFREPIFEK